MSTNCMREVLARYACRAFTVEDVDEEALGCVLNAGRLAPSGYGLEPWRFVVIRNPDLRRRAAAACFDQAPATTAPVLIVLVALTAALRPGSAFVQTQLEAEAAGNDPAPLLEGYRAFYRDADISAWATGQCQIAAAFMMLEATHQELASCPIGGFDIDKLGQVLKLPTGETPAMALALGHCADAQGTRRRRKARDVITYLGE